MFEHGLLDASDDALIACSLDGRFVLWNRGAEALYGYTTDEAVGQDRTLIIPPEARDAATSTWDRVVAGERIEPEEYVRVTKDGRRIVVINTVSPIRLADGAVAAVASIGRDVTALKETEEALGRAHAQVLEASRLKSEFITNMNHELRTPMNGLIGITALLADTDLDPQQQEFVHALSTSADALMGVIKDMLDFARIETEALALEDAPFDLRALVEDVRSMIDLGSSHEGVEMVAMCDTSLPELLVGDRSRVGQVLTNLLSNAIKFTERGEVAVRVAWKPNAAPRERLRIEVTDTGTGIEPEAREVIFASFAQADGSTTRRHGGTGLGLTIAKELVELMGGEIGVTSEPSRGSTFWFTLPLAPVHTDDAGITLASLDGARVLVADDDAASRRVLEEYLHEWDVTVTTVADADAVVETLQRAQVTAQPYDVLLLDAGLAGAATSSLTRAVRADVSVEPVRVILVESARREPAGEEIAVVDGRVSKPVDRAALYGEIVRAIDERSAGADGRREPSELSRGRVLVADSDPEQQHAAARVLESVGFSVEVAVPGAAAAARHAQEPYDVIFVDCKPSAPEEACVTAREVRRLDGAERHTPIVAMLVDPRPGEVERCLAAGTDYYSVKPISAVGVEYVVARMRRAA
jgi:PAS domain S-box-containing protein